MSCAFIEKVTIKEGDTTTIGNIIKDYIEDNGQEYVTAKFHRHHFLHFYHFDQ